MSHFAVINANTKAIERKVSKQVSEYTSGLRNKMDEKTNFKDEYNKMFGGFADRKLAKDDLYYSIKNDMEQKEKEAERKKKKGEKDKKDGVLPTVHKDEKDEL